MPLPKKSIQETCETKKSLRSENDVIIEDVGSDDEADENPPRVEPASVDELEALFANIFGDKKKHGIRSAKE